VSSALQQRVIVSLSGPDVDSRILCTAMTLARAFDAVLYAIDVQQIGPRSSPDVQGSAPRMQDAYFALSKAGGLPDDVDVRIVVVGGEPGAELVRLASRPTDLLVVGRGSDGNLSSDSVGAIAQDCLANADCAVIVVPPPLRSSGATKEHSPEGANNVC